MATIKIGVQIRPQHTTWEAYRDAWLWADEAGIDVIYSWDHFFPLFGTQPDNPYRTYHFEAWTLQAALGAQTKRAQVSCLVHSVGYRNPALLSNMAKTLDHITNGRYVLGIGAGWAQRDYDEFGYEFGAVRDRLDALERALPRIERRLARVNPPPLREHIPILIGGGGVKRTLKLVARHADIWHAFGSVDVFREKSAILEEHCAAEGRDPAEIERSWAVGSRMGDDPDALRAAGVMHLIIGITGNVSGYDLGPLRELVQWRDAVIA